MRVLLDTNVLSELRKPKPQPQVVKQVRAIASENAYLSCITMGELEYGIQRLLASAKRRALETWLLELEQDFADHILPFDLETARIWGELVAKGEVAGRVLPIQDAQIAATAIQHRLCLMTRNVADFEHTGVRLLNPWDAV